MDFINILWSKGRPLLAMDSSIRFQFMLHSLYTRIHCLSKKKEVSFPLLLFKYIVAAGSMTIAAPNLLWQVGGVQGDSHLATALSIQVIPAQKGNRGRIHIHHASCTSSQGKENTWNVPSRVLKVMQEFIIMNTRLPGILEH